MSGEAGLRFDLITEPWILAESLDGHVEEVSLEHLLREAHQLRAILGELPSQVFAITRVVLAILHRSVGGPRDARDWKRLWDAPELPTSGIEAYLDAHRDKFDLLHPTTPFYQVADLHTAKSEVFSLDRLIADVPTGAQYFTTRAGSGVERLTFAEAARWLIHCQAFDASGIKSGAVGDERVKGGRGYPIGTGWAGMLGGILVEGDTLADTLRLNLVPTDVGLMQSAAEDLPVWEREPQTATEEQPGGRAPHGPLDLFTWQSRRIRLFTDPDGVYGCLIANGDKLTPQDRFTHEPMSSWRRSPAQEKKLKLPLVYMPLTHDPGRALWRGLEALLPERPDAEAGREAEDRLRPGVLKWLAQAQADGMIAPDYRIRTRAIGAEYGSQQAVVDEVIDDSLAMAIVLLKADDRALGRMAIDAAADAERGAQALGWLAADITSAAGGDSAAARTRGREVAYGELDGPFRTWLASLEPDSDPETCQRDWHDTARRILFRLGAELVNDAGVSAWRGRWIERGKVTEHKSSPEADLRFRGSLARIFVYASDPPAQEEGTAA